MNADLPDRETMMLLSLAYRVTVGTSTFVWEAETGSHTCCQLGIILITLKNVAV